MQIIGFYNEYGYQIEDSLDGEVFYHAGNNPLESSSVVDLKNALPLDKIKEYCERTGKEIAEEKGADFIGVEYLDNENE